MGCCRSKKLTTEGEKDEKVASIMGYGLVDDTPKDKARYKAKAQSFSVQSEALEVARRYKLDPALCLEYNTSSHDSFMEWARETLLYRNDAQALLIIQHKDYWNGKNHILQTSAYELLANAIRENPNLCILRLEGQRLSTEQAEILVGALASHPGIRQVDLFHNMIPDATGLYIAQALKHNMKLRKLNLGDNQLTAAVRDTIEREVHIDNRYPLKVAF